MRRTITDDEETKPNQKPNMFKKQGPTIDRKQLSHYTHECAFAVEIVFPLLHYYHNEY